MDHGPMENCDFFFSISAVLTFLFLAQLNYFVIFSFGFLQVLTLASLDAFGKLHVKKPLMHGVSFLMNSLQWLYIIAYIILILAFKPFSILAQSLDLKLASHLSETKISHIIQSQYLLYFPLCTVLHINLMFAMPSLKLLSSHSSLFVSNI